MSAYEFSVGLMSAQVFNSKINKIDKMLSFKMTSPYCFANILVYFSPNDKKVDIFKVYAERAVEKRPRWNF